MLRRDRGVRLGDGERRRAAAPLPRPLLRHTVLGELAVETYYTFGPAVAGVVGESDLLRRPRARHVLRPLVELGARALLSRLRDRDRDGAGEPTRAIVSVAVGPHVGVSETRAVDGRARSRPCRCRCRTGRCRVRCRSAAGRRFERVHAAVVVPLRSMMRTPLLPSGTPSGRADRDAGCTA